MSKTLGESIKEMEADLEAYRAADHFLSIWKLRFAITDDYGKRLLLEDLMEKAGLTKEEISKCFK